MGVRFESVLEPAGGLLRKVTGLSGSQQPRKANVALVGRQQMCVLGTVTNSIAEPMVPQIEGRLEEA